jgi:hypothetical protein
MDLLRGAMGMLVCLANMAVVMPLGMRVARRVRRATATHAPEGNAAGSPDAPTALDHTATAAHKSHQERG